MHSVSQVLAFTDFRVGAAYLIFAASYLVFALGKFPGLKLDRPGAAIIGAVCMVAFRIIPPGQVLQSIDFSTIVLLFSMMLIVGNLHLVGFFEWNARIVLQRLRPAYLLPAVIFTCGFLSAFFVNDIVCLVMVPFVLTIVRQMHLEPAPYMLAVATSSNIGSVATITGNPQNMLVGTYSGIPYRAFLLHMAPIAIIGLALNWLVLHAMYRSAAVAGASAPNQIPLPRVDLSKLTKPVAVVTVVVIGFFLGVPPAMMAALGAAALLITRTLEPHRVYQEVDWGVLVFFVGLFVIVGGASQAGIVDQLLYLVHDWNLQRTSVFSVVTVLLGNIVSNVPAVMLLKTVVPSFADPYKGWLTLAMASTLAGNLTVTGSVANIIVVETAKPDVEISFWEYLKVGAPITLLTLLVGCAWLAWMG